MNTTPFAILIVEDSETQAMSLKLLLEQEGWQATCAESAEKALKLLANRSFDLIIVDYNLPGIKGDEFCRQVKMQFNTRSIPVLMLTIEDEMEMEKQGLQSGADDFLPKHTDKDVLLMKISALLGRAAEPQIPFSNREFLFRQSRVLAVDDSPTYLEYMVQAFAEDGVQIDRATCARDALIKIENNSYDCVLVDLVMPEMDGIELCRRIMVSRLENYKSMVVLMLTAHENKEDMKKALEAGADDFVGKSNDITIIKARLSALLRRKFIQEENQRILEQLKKKEIEAETSRIEKEASQAKAMLADQLQITVGKLEKEIVERKKLEDNLTISNQELEEFAYAVSHDLQEPLRSIAGFLTLISNQYAEKLDDKGKDYIERTVKASVRMHDLINGILEISRIGRQNDPFEKQNLQHLVDEVVGNLQISISRKKARISYSNLPEAYVNKLQMIRVFQNLLSNAMKFCEQDHPVIDISVAKEETCWKFSIKDNGIGIALESKERIFQIFQRLHVRDKYPGTGIGLSVVKKIINHHGGKIWLESEPDHGTTFFFTLPFVPSD